MVEPIDESLKIEAVKRIYEVAKAELEQLGGDESIGSLLHLATMVWVSEHIDAGLLTDQEPEIDPFTQAAAHLSARVKYACVTRGDN